ncbi:MAG: AAA family ATPase [Planctomycetes bacterium]|nr:AAA family ATPase [Planctomycetota bacterium]
MSGRRRLLVQWIGHSDFRAMAGAMPARVREEILRRIRRGDSAASAGSGPIKTLLDTQPFDEVRILSNYPESWNKRYASWLGRAATFIPVPLENPTDYRAIFAFADSELGALAKRPDSAKTELCLHLSPGTPAMAAVWLLLGKTRYPAAFYETFAERSWITDVPFDLTIDVIPEMLREPDRHFQHLASESPGEVEGFENIVGGSRTIREAVGRAKRAAMRSVSVLILGESGTGKELFAQAIHKAGPRRSKPFLAINCAAISKTLLESELFGHTRGTFTGADRDRGGAFEAASGGTLFLDEVGECDSETQAKLLRVLQPISGEGPSVRTIRRLGDDRDRRVDVRVIAATNRDLPSAIRNGSFREDLYYRLAVITIALPSLRDRVTDIPLIAERLLAQINDQFARDEPDYSAKRLDKSALTFARRYSWPGNIRQLHNTLVQAAVLADSPVLTRGDLAAAVGGTPVIGPTAPSPLDQPLGDGFKMEAYLADIHRTLLQRAMAEANGVKAQAARLLGLRSYQTLDAQLTRLRIAPQGPNESRR